MISYTKEDLTFSSAAAATSYLSLSLSLSQELKLLILQKGTNYFGGGSCVGKRPLLQRYCYSFVVNSR